MDYVDQIFDRANIQHIREFLLHGVEYDNISSESYSERLMKAEKNAINFCTHYIKTFSIIVKINWQAMKFQ